MSITYPFTSTRPKIYIVIHVTIKLLNLDVNIQNMVKHIMESMVWATGNHDSIVNALRCYKKTYKSKAKTFINIHIKDGGSKNVWVLQSSFESVWFHHIHTHTHKHKYPGGHIQHNLQYSIINAERVECDK